MKIAFECLFGSHLYGTMTENSDLDYKGVFIPDRDSILLQSVVDVITDNTSDNTKKNDKTDIDREWFSLQKFLSLLCSNDIVSFDMLHASKTCTLKTSYPFEWLQENRKMFYTTQLAERYREYCMKQAKRYGIKGSAIDTIKRCIAELSASANQQHRTLIETAIGSVPGVIDASTFFIINQKRFHKTSRVNYVLPLLEDQYQRLTANSQDGVNYKNLSHAIRVGYQMIELLDTNDLIFPLKPHICNRLIKIKTGKCDYEQDVKQEIDYLMNEVKLKAEVAKLNGLPDVVDKNRVNAFLISQYYKACQPDFWS